MWCGIQGYCFGFECAGIELMTFRFGLRSFRYKQFPFKWKSVRYKLKSFHRKRRKILSSLEVSELSVQTGLCLHGLMSTTGSRHYIYSFLVFVCF